ncbi:protein of unknown function [Desulfacinum infernum DSM 9756]|uniref:Protein NO VEIN C-terminal domain-containing protein n=1 Tax=Desulfacinum infernum DSM 9756 TaxID=1121391 RepID=A0A1M5IWD5_9BACT|nr:DUF3883 domain-containing protein [Desulfacinum infernum]SHG32379.1 protein of unknown function [Desulfacinum infernum DSM 9756]
MAINKGGQNSVITDGQFSVVTPTRDSDGRVVRYIEVKSMSGPWTDTYAVLSRPQFEAARKFGEAFWLYVVERAQTDDFRIHRIQNPIGRANHFMFDDGWRVTAESDEPMVEEPEEENGKGDFKQPGLSEMDRGTPAAG